MGGRHRRRRFTRLSIKILSSRARSTGSSADTLPRRWPGRAAAWPGPVAATDREVVACLEPAAIGPAAAEDCLGPAGTGLLLCPVPEPAATGPVVAEDCPEPVAIGPLPCPVP